MKTDVREVISNEAEPTWGDVFTHLRTKEGRRVLALGYKMILGFEAIPDRPLTDEEKAHNYETMIIERKAPSRRFRSVALATVAVAAALTNLPRSTEHNALINRRADDLAAESMKPPQPGPQNVEIIGTLPEAA
jgi:hypothetical protein